MINRTHAFAVLSGGVVAATAVYACSSSSNPGTSPPVNEAGADVTSSGSGSSGSGSSSGSINEGGSDSPTGADGGPPPACTSLQNTVYIESGDTQEPLLKALGRKLRDEANITIVFELTGSCTLSPNLYNNVPIPKNTSMLYIPSTAENPTWVTSDPEATCTTDPNNGTSPNLGISALFPTSCAGLAGGPPAGIGEFNGPIQAYTFIVPSAEFATQTSISAAEAYYAFGDGVNNPVTPAEWNDPTAFFLRPATKSTLVATALNIDLTAAEMTLAQADGGTSDGRQLLASSTQVLSGVKASTNPKAIGILGDEVYDANRNDDVNVLAYQGFGVAGGAWWPDSTQTSFDKQNIRDGNYTLWSPTVYIAPVTSGVPTNPAVKYITDLVLGNQGAAPPNGLVDGGTPIDGLGTVVSVGLTPNCAMQVQRAGDGAPVTAYTPAAPCTCYFLSKIPNAAALPASCTTCTSNSQCGTNQCFNGYCEGGSTNVTSTPITKNVTIPTSADGGLEPLNP